MKQWYCFKCNEEMQEADIEGTYLEVTRFIRGLKCPKCGAWCLTEEQATLIWEGEALLEQKFG